MTTKSYEAEEKSGVACHGEETVSPVSFIITDAVSVIPLSWSTDEILDYSVTVWSIYDGCVFYGGAIAVTVRDKASSVCWLEQQAITG